MVLDCDAVYHTLLKTNTSLLSAIAARFPEAMEEDTLNRKKLGTIVFANASALKDLNEITHSAVKTEVLRQLSDAPALVAIDAIGLFEGGLSPLCDITVAVTAPEETRIARIVARDKVSADYARSRIRAQRPQEEFISLCDYALENNGTKEEFYRKCLGFFKKWAIIEQNTT